MQKLKNNTWVLCVILVIAVVLRVVAIGKVPPALNWDEVSHGFNAYSLLRSGRDEWGQRLPIIFRAYGDYKLPVYIYITALSEYIFGLSMLAVRMPAIIAGLLSVLFTYLLVKEIFDDQKVYEGRKIAFIAALFMAIEPWSVFLSRGAFEANLALFFVISGAYFYLKGLRVLGREVIAGVVLLGLSLWTYNSARVFTPLLLVGFSVIYKSQVKKFWHQKPSVVIMSTMLLLVAFAPMGWQLVNSEGRARYGWVAIVDEGAVGEIIRRRAESPLGVASRLIYNRPLYFAYNFSSNYIAHFSPSFLFFMGGDNYQFSLPGHGLIYAVNAVFIIIGIFTMVKKKARAGVIMFIWIVLSPVASALTRESPHVLRAIVMLPIPMVLTAVGLVETGKVLGKSKRRVFAVVYGVLLIALVGRYFYGYFIKYPREYSWSWQYGYKEAVGFIKNIYDDYDRIVVSKKYGEPHEFVLFYWPWEPEKYREDENLVRFNQSNWYWVDGFDKFVFVNDWEVVNGVSTDFVTESGARTDCGEIKCLLVTSPGNVPEGWIKLETINFLNGEKAFEIYEN